MNDIWHEAITQHEIAVQADGLIEFFQSSPHPDEARPILCDASYLVGLDLTGPDAHKFLQGQITQDVARLNAGLAFIADHCNSKGRIIATFIAAPIGIHKVRLFVPRNNHQVLLEHFKKYLPFSKATIEIADDQCLFSISGENIEALLDLAGANHPSVPWACNVENNEIIIKTGAHDYLISADTKQSVQRWQQLAPECQRAGARYWRGQQIARGIVWVDYHNREEYTPHQLNHQCADIISFRKGCYTGQEVIARMHYKATLKSHVYLFSLKTDVPVQAGREIYSQGKKAGGVINAEEIAPDRWLLLAEIRIDSIDNPLYLSDEEGKILDRMALPYAIN